MKCVAAVRRDDWQPPEYSWICLVHFINGKSDDPLSIFEYVRSPLKRKRVPPLEDYTRCKRSCFTQLEAAAKIDASTTLLMLESASVIDDRLENQEESGNEQAEAVMTTDAACTQTEMTLNSIKDLEEAVAKVERDKEELVECAKKQKVAKELTLVGFQADDNKVKFYTGFPPFLL